MKHLNLLSNSIQIIKLVLTGPDKLPEVNKAEFLNPKDVQNHLSPDDPVIGLEINGEARAYPIKWVREQQIVTDVVGGKTVILTYWDEFKKATAHIIDSNPYALRKVTAPLQDHNVVLYDSNKKQLIEETTGEIFFGPKRGERLEALPVRIVPWVTWQTNHPDSKVYSYQPASPKDSAVISNYSKTPTFGFGNSGTRLYLSFPQLAKLFA